MQRVYLALIHGIFPENEGQVHTLIGRHPVYRQKMSVNVRTGRDAITNWKVKERFSYFTWMELRLQTGRTHQIRVHMSHLGYPVVGDKVYGRGKIPKDCPLKIRSAIADLPGQALHAHSLGFNHPVSGKYMEFLSPPPMYIQKILNILKESSY